MRDEDADTDSRRALRDRWLERVVWAVTVLAALGIATDKHVERAVVRLASGFVLTIEPRHFGSSVDIMPFLPRDLDAPGLWLVGMEVA